MRARNIKADFFKNEILAELSYEARLLFIGLWCMADRDGRLEDRPKRIQGEVFPYDQIDADRLLRSLAESSTPFIIRYSTDSGKFIQIVNFCKHQNPHQNESPSKIPKFAKSSEALAPIVEAHGLIPDVLIPDSLSLIPDSPSAPKSAVVVLIDYFHFKQSEKLGEKPASFNGGALGRLFKAALKSHTEDEAKQRIDFWFESTDPFIQTNGYSPTLFTSKYTLLKGGPLHAGKSTSNPHVKLTQNDQARRAAYAD